LVKKAKQMRCTVQTSDGEGRGAIFFDWYGSSKG
jgi:hypothetical protein